MEHKYRLIKERGLNWQAELIHDAQSDIKLLIKNCLIQKKSLIVIKKEVSAVINHVINQIENTELKSRTKNALYKLADKVYMELAPLIGNEDTLLLLLLLKGQDNYKAIIQKPKEEVLKQFPDNIYNRAVPNEKYMQDYMKDVEKKLIEISSIKPKEDYSSNVSLRNIAEMSVRYEHQMNMLNSLINQGVRLVWIEPHANCSERCEPYQGKLYSLNGTSGSIDGQNYVPIETAMDVYYTTKAGKTYKNGCISGYGCRHKLVPYKTGFKPQVIPASVIDKQRAIEAKQRYYERKIRRYDDASQMLQGLNNLDAKKLKLKAKQTYKEYVNFSKENNVPYYPSRT